MRFAGMRLPGNCTPVTRIDNRRRNARQIAGAPLGRCQGPQGRATGLLPYPLIVGEKENAISDDRPAKCAAEDILPEVVLRRVVAVVRPGVRIERVIAKELENVPVQIVRLPDFSVAFTVAPVTFPNSAEELLVSILNSASASMFGL